MHPIFVPVKVPYGSKCTAPLCGNLLAPVPNGGKRPSVVCCPWQGTPQTRSQRSVLRRKPDPISNHLDHRGPGLPNSRHTPSRCSLARGLAARGCPTRGRCSNPMRKQNCGLGCRAQRHFARFKNPLVIFPTRSFPTNLYKIRFPCRPPQAPGASGAGRLRERERPH